MQQQQQTLGPGNIEIVSRTAVEDSIDSYQITYTVKIYIGIPNNIVPTAASKNTALSDEREYSITVEEGQIVARSSFSEGNHSHENEGYYRAPVLYVDITYNNPESVQDTLTKISSDLTQLSFRQKIFYIFRPYNVSTSNNASGYIIGELPFIPEQNLDQITITDINSYTHMGLFYSTYTGGLIPCKIIGTSATNKFVID